MARPRRCRRICTEPAYDSFVPEGISSGSQVVLTLDEYEAIRLIDLEKFTHEHCAAQMDISRTTVTEIYEEARRKIADCIVNGKSLLIMGGDYRFCDGSAARFCQKTCRRNQAEAGRLPVKGENEMRVAVTYENGQVFQHFGHSRQFKIYQVENGVVTDAGVVDTAGSGHGALAGFLQAQGVQALICGGIGGGARTALAQAGITLYPGVSGAADEQVQALVSGGLRYDPNASCGHHHGEHGHSCGEHDHHCGGHGEGHCHGHGN